MKHSGAGTRRWSRSGRAIDRLLAQITGMDGKTIRRGREEMGAELTDCPSARVRLPGAG
ncbi:MAG: hypothetical protein M3Y74_07475 [Chloroflexota bacterium]|nr:hypothetical protein [Chloroflexota bacterium]